MVSARPSLSPFRQTCLVSIRVDHSAGNDGDFSALRSYGDAAHCRKALHRAVQCTSDYPEHVCEVLLTFERVEGECLSNPTSSCFWLTFINSLGLDFIVIIAPPLTSVLYPSSGSLEDWDAAMQKTESRLNRVNEQRAKARRLFFTCPVVNTPSVPFEFKVIFFAHFCGNDIHGDSCY